MAQVPRRGRPTRDESEALDRRLRTAALDAFVANGFDGTTMESIAAAAGITKRTLYAKFADKHELFATVVPWALARSAVDEVELDLPDELESALRLLGRHIVARVVAPEAVQVRRLAILESRRFPEYAEGGNHDVWRRSVQALVVLLERHRELGEIALDDVELAADQLIAMFAGISTILADLGVRRQPESEARNIDEAVRLFLDGARPR